MSRKVQVFNPVHLQKIKKQSLTVMGRVAGGDRTPLSIYLNALLIRKVTPSANGAFECRVDLSKLDNNQHAVEVRKLSSRGTERLLIPFIKACEESEPDQNDS